MAAHHATPMAKFWLTSDALLNTHGGVTYPHCWECLARRCLYPSHVGAYTPPTAA